MSYEIESADVTHFHRIAPKTVKDEDESNYSDMETKV